MIGFPTGSVASTALLLLAMPLYAAQTLIPAGSLIRCTVNERISSKTIAVGDPVLCTVGARSPMLAHALLSGVFTEYKDPGHLVGRGWMDLEFDRIILPNAQVVSIDAKVVAAEGYHVDLKGRIRGKGHRTRDTIKWLIPVLWPEDLIMLPGRGPRPVLRPETHIVVKVMVDTVVDLPERPRAQQVYGSRTPPRDRYGFAKRIQPESYRIPPIDANGYPPPPVYPVFAPRLRRWSALHVYDQRPAYMPVPRPATARRYWRDGMRRRNAGYGYSRWHYRRAPHRR